MSKKKTPREKKEASYDKDHYTFAWSSPHGFQKTWKKKNYVNRVLRRKSKGLLHEVEKSSYEQLSPEQESHTAELFRKSLSKKKLRKGGVVTLRKKIETKREYRESSFNLKARSEAGRIAGFKRFLNALLSDKEYTEKNLLNLTRLATLSHFQESLEKEPLGAPKLEQGLLSAQKRIAWRQSKNKQRSSETR